VQILPGTKTFDSSSNATDWYTGGTLIETPQTHRTRFFMLSVLVLQANVRIITYNLSYHDGYNPLLFPIQYLSTKSEVIVT
jgi:hypothetical protein